MSLNSSLACVRYTSRFNHNLHHLALHHVVTMTATRNLHGSVIPFPGHIVLQTAFANSINLIRICCNNCATNKQQQRLRSAQKRPVGQETRDRVLYNHTPCGSNHTFVVDFIFPHFPLL